MQTVGGSRELERAGLEAAQKQVEYWSQMVLRLERAAGKGRRIPGTEEFQGQSLEEFRDNSRDRKNSRDSHSIQIASIFSQEFLDQCKNYRIACKAALVRKPERVSP